MDISTKKIYNAIFEKKCTKADLAVLLDKTEKTVENKIKGCKEIKWSKKSQCYHFENLIPGYISYNHLCKLMLGNINNINIRKDLDAILNQEGLEDNLVMVDTSVLSTIFQNIIKLTVAINHQCDVVFSYIGYKQTLETKYVRPYKVFVSNGIFYLHGQYSAKNGKDVGQMRSFALNSISQLEIAQYHDTELEFGDSRNNAFGAFSDKSKSINLVFDGPAAIFLKREGLVDFHWSFIGEDVNGQVNIVLHYNNEQEVVTLMQKWMPYISFENQESIESKKIAGKIRNNFEFFSNNLTT